MKILSASQFYEADAYTISTQGITSDALMERAATEIFNWLHVRLQGAPITIHLFCGIGNNGGDGIAVARLMQEHGYNIKVYVVNYSDKRSKDFLLNLERLKDRKIWPAFLQEDSELPEIAKEDIVVDAIFGIGLNRAPAPWVKRIIQYINDCKAFVLAVDIPSGLYADGSPDDVEAVVEADFVLTIQLPKLSFFLPTTGVFCKQWEVVNIGLDQGFIQNTPAAYKLIGKNEALQFYRPREKYSHKGTYGHTLIVGGSMGKIGALILSATACLKSGSGLVTTYGPKCGYIPLQTAVPEAMMIVDKGEECITNIEYIIKPTVVCMGMGMGQDVATAKAVEQFLTTYKGALLLDADALNLLSSNEDWWSLLPQQTVLTPHPKELERLIGAWKNEDEKLKKAKAFSAKYSLIIVIKGANTMVISNGIGYINTSGNPGMATGGSGDVLSGIIGGLIAQQYTPLQAAIFGVYLHGKAADIAVSKTGYQSLTASIIADHLGSAYISLFETQAPATEQQKE